jgi:hypothetical protein
MATATPICCSTSSTAATSSSRRSWLRIDPFAEWGEVYPNTACVVSIVDRLVHHSEILVIEGESYRIREAKERAARKKKTAKPRRRAKNSSTSEPPA